MLAQQAITAQQAPELTRAGMESLAASLTVPLHTPVPHASAVEAVENGDWFKGCHRCRFVPNLLWQSEATLFLTFLS